ncbi:CPBP family glutamic-type intramembrane protease [uncultured Polaribacter sp.]|uniref:CPBP family glutamic-type intramembrane protease n=1 Tax=uncultured Polaribacter sp. TaxID=174711 RepID=UPI00262CB8E8|nr:CPBP family glutamic-type intramembrane protease [uncultured Polaribacter sp.]
MNYIQQVFKGKNEWYHWLITVCLVLFGWQILGAIPLIIVALSKTENLAEFTRLAENNFTTAGLNKNFLLFLMLFMFAVGLVFLCIGVKYIHKRSIKSLITSRKKIDWQRFLFGFIVWGIIAFTMSYCSILLAPENFIWNFNAKHFFILVAISFIFIPLQTSFEELLFRGYFMQGIGAATTKSKFPLYFITLLISIIIISILNLMYGYNIFSMIIVLGIIVFLSHFVISEKLMNSLLNSNLNKTLFGYLNTKLTPLLITSLIFGLLHGANPEVAKLGQITMVFYIGTGLFFGIVTLMDEGTELALGLHAINNISAAFLITTDWTVFQTDALYIDTSEPSVTWEMFIPVFVFYPLMLLLFSKKYGWQNWKEKLAEKIEMPTKIDANYKNLDEIGTT